MGESDFAEFYEAHFGHLVAQLYALTADLAEAQDCAQEAFIRAWPRWSKIRDYDNPQAWLYRVGYRLAVSRWRRAARSRLPRVRQALEPVPNPEPSADTMILVEALRKVSESQRRALVLHYMVGLTVAQIAAEEGVAVGTVKARLSRGRTAMAGWLADEVEPDGRQPQEVPNA